MLIGSSCCYLALHINQVLPPTFFMQAQEQGCWKH
jgi:hypothetical protein